MLRNLRTLSACLMLATPAAGKPDYPPTERIDHVDSYETPDGTVEVADPYRWLEEDVRESDRVAAWVARQQAFTEAYLSDLPERAAFERRLTELWNYERRSPPRRIGMPGESPRRYTYSKNDGLQNQAVVYLTSDPAEDGEVLIDPNAWSEDGTVALAGYSASHDGKLLAYQRSEAGSDWKTIRVLDLETGEELADTLRWVKFGGIQWTPDGAGFYYARYPEPEEGAEHQATALNRTICYHRLGAEQGEDRVVYEDPEHPDWTFSPWVTEDGAYVLLTIRRGTDPQNKLYCKRLGRGAPGEAPWIKLVDDFESDFSPFACVGDRLYLYTDDAAPRHRVVAYDLASAGEGVFRERLTEVIGQREANLEWASLVGGRLFANYLEDAASAVRVHTADGEFVESIGLPGVGTARGFGGWQDADETFFTYSSYDSPASTYRYDVATAESQLLFRPEVSADLSEFTVRRDFYTSKDGTRVPIFLMHKKGISLDGANPTLLYAYGGFNISITPGYSPSRAAWVERGGVLAVANLRGGGEYGEHWHEAGKLANKQNVFDDFIAAAEWLCAQKITSPARLAIQGGSNGGLLVGAVMTQRPDLFGACLPAVGVMDMLRFHRFTAGQFWRDEFGSADDPEMFPVLRAYSPLHNLRAGTRYPATLVTTADTDDRVVPMHSFKFAAALQRAQAGDAPTLIRIETRAGHGAGTPTSKRIELAADLWAFLWQNIAD